MYGVHTIYYTAGRIPLVHNRVSNLSARNYEQLNNNDYIPEFSQEY